MRNVYFLIFLTIFGCVNKPKPAPEPIPKPPAPKPEPKPPEPYKGKTGIVFLIGTGAQCFMYMASLRYWERKGYEVRCPRTNHTANGESCLAEISRLKTQFPGIKIGISGHSQGGGASFVCAAKAEKRWGGTYPIVGVQPAHGFELKPWGTHIPLYRGLKSPSFQWNGDRDGLVPMRGLPHAVKPGYDLLPGEKYLYTAVGAKHMMPLPINWISESHLFFDWKLKNDMEAKKAFLNLPNTRRWRRP